MKAGWGATVLVSMALALSVCGSGTWLYPNDFYSASASSSSWHWLETCQHYARFQFHRLPVEQSTVLLEMLVSVPALTETRPPATQAVRVQVRPTGGSWTSRQVALHLTQNRGSDWIYEGQIVLSRRALQIGTNLDVWLEPVSWNQPLGVYEGSVRVRSPMVRAVAAESIALPSTPAPASAAAFAGATLGAGGPLIADESGGAAARSGTLSPTSGSGEDSLSYRLPLSAGQWLLLEAELTGGSGELKIISPGGRTVAVAEGTGKLELSYRAYVGGIWTVRLEREIGEEVRYRLRMETSG